MPKTIIINETIAKSQKLNEAILLGQLPLDIQQSLLGGQTPLGNNPAIPNNDFLTKIITKHFSEIQAKLKLEEEDDIVGKLSEITAQCQEIERPIRGVLEKICFTEVYEFFQIPQESTDFTISLVDDVNQKFTNDVQLDANTNDEYEYRDGDDIGRIESEVAKREIINTLIMGASMVFARNILEKILSKYDLITPELKELYNDILNLNEYLLFTKEDIGMTDQDPKQGGFVKVTFGDEETKNTIQAEGIVFPILLIEMIHGFMEIFASHGLPKDRDTAELVLSKTDYLKANPWEMRLGPGLWHKFSYSMGPANSSWYPYFFMRVCCLPVPQFNELMNEMFMETERAKKIIAPVLKQAKDNAERYDFNTRMNKRQVTQTVISDEFIMPEEL